MKDLLRRRFSFVLNQFTDLKLLPGRVPSYVLLFDSSTAAQDIAFMLSGQWDGCNGVVMPFYDEVSVNTAAKLYGTSWFDTLRSHIHGDSKLNVRTCSTRVSPSSVEVPTPLALLRGCPPLDFANSKIFIAAFSSRCNLQPQTQM